MKAKYFIFTCIAMLLLTIQSIQSCSIIEVNDDREGFQTESYSYDTVMVSATNPLFADLHNHSVSTRSDIDYCEYVSLESLLNREETLCKTVKHYKLKEIPFISNKSPEYATLSKGIPESGMQYELSGIYLFLVETIDTILNISDLKVVTMIPDKYYLEKKGANSCSFIDKGVFSGIIIYSNLDGTFRDVYVYGGDLWPIIEADIISSNDASSYDQMGYLSVIRQVKTRTDGAENGGEIDASYCVANKQISNIWGTLSLGWYDYINGDAADDDLIWPDDLSGGGGGGDAISGSASTIVSGTISSGTNTNVPVMSPVGGSVGVTPSVMSPIVGTISEDISTATVMLYSANGGSTIGSGTYQLGSRIFCQASPHNNYIFDRWTGDFKGEGDFVDLILNNDLESTAYFKILLQAGPVRPCLDTLKGVINPLMKMQLAPSNLWDNNFKGATFGKTRYNTDGTLKSHNGLDLYAEPGTAIYAMYDGVISDFHYCSEQPDRVSRRKYPEGYIGDKNDAGNRIHIDCLINNERVLIGYWHLNANIPIAINPRTGVPFVPGDKVFQGEIIAYSGKTGNCVGIPYYHLHLAVIDYDKRFTRDKYLNPEMFINGSINWTDKNNSIVYSKQIINIKCHEDYDYQ